ncbi:polysaccharide deacetylase family protein [Methyloligella sp. 2.7D]|uniref:polysaccharide deacetylase family protein n=1 Tax=unclassified Methyloligella TaxID=2625955 RepID=UPI00157D7A24|nr:polysaccharide deacetylase family protein [Methyloligella sp. GL2]QKP77580.1 polysaccharide deacetylase family protein [Methyloligella sp. GL2]
MSKVKTAVFKAAMSGLYHSGATKLLAPYTQGSGLIYMLHRVHPEQPEEFAPNRILEISPDFLEAVLNQVEEAGLDVVTLDEAVRRLKQGDERRFVSFTFDDGYKDNAEYAYPLFKKRNIPMTIYVPSDYADGRGELWWLALEEVVRQADRIELCRDGALWQLPTATIAEKKKSFDQIYWWLRSIDEVLQRQVVRVLAERHGIDMMARCRELIMNWDELRELAADPLVTIGGHTKGHYAVAKLSAANAKEEMIGGADRIEAELGTRPEHFAYPYGDELSAGPRDFWLAKECGFKTAVTTRKGMIFPAHREHLTALPRVSLNGDYQSLTYTALYLSGAPFALWNRFREVNAA